MGSRVSTEPLLTYFGLIPEAVTHGFVWQLVTYSFLHVASGMC